MPKTTKPPSANTTHWGIKIKAAVVDAIHTGQITRQQAYAMYDLSAEELKSWEIAIAKGGKQELSIKSIHTSRRRAFRRRLPLAAD